ncbi:MAG: hypothetical protein JW863_02225 [Chitinispirillaceae bacterium]|nr:hypothetical protein [Chitinispirillaceae bacterium]
MRRVVPSFCRAVVVVVLTVVPVSARVFFTGSNPVLSSIALPQDLLLIPGGDKISFYSAWQGFPWWGDIDQPEERPYKQYAQTGERTEDGEHYTSINQFEERMTVSRWHNERLRTSYNLHYTADHLSAKATGLDDAGDPTYTYNERNAIREVNFKAMLATYYKSTPIGFSLGLGGVSTSAPRLDHKRYSGSTVTSSNLLLWGWRTGSAEPLPQEEFAIGSLFKGDAQVAATLGNHKIGSHFRLYAGTLDDYNWNGSNDYDINLKKIHNYTVRLYGLYNWFRMEKFRFNTTVLTRYTFVDSINVRKDNPRSEIATEKAKVFVLQVNPNVNIFPWKFPMSYIDAALLCNYQFTRYDYLLPNNDYHWSTIGWDIEEYSWEQCSYYNENFFELALDVFASIPVFGMRDRSAGITVSTLVWRRYKWKNKYFGDMENGDFRIDEIRRSFDKETWLNLVLGLMYRQGSFMYRLDIGQPLIYSLTPRTGKYNGNGDLIEGKYSEKMWLSQSGFKIGFFVSTDLTNLIRYRPFVPDRQGL